MANGWADKLGVLREKAITSLGKLSWLALLLGRLGVGVLFLSTGWGKVHDIPKVTAFFTELGIPMPGLNAIVVGYSELLCGSALVLGLLTRLATIPLIVSMVIAIATAKRGDIHNVFDLFGADEFTYLLVLLMIAILGPGKASLDQVIAKKLGWKT